MDVINGSPLLKMPQEQLALFKKFRNGIQIFRRLSLDSSLKSQHLTHVFGNRGKVTDLVSLDASKMDNKWRGREKELGSGVGRGLSRSRLAVTVLGPGRSIPECRT